jgi:hypothetical protein
MRGAADETESHFGPIDIWINNAMTTVFAPFLEVTPKEYKRDGGYLSWCGMLGNLPLCNSFHSSWLGE